jgi:hypothetical protein
MAENGFTVEIHGHGTHYVWNENKTGLVEKDGEIDGSQPFFVVPEQAQQTHAQEWPAGWTDIGCTDE